MRPVVMPKVTVACASRQDQVVVGHGLIIVQEYSLGLCINPHYLAQQHLSVLLFAQHAANRGRNFRRGEHSRCHLVQQRLKQVMVIAVDHRHIDRYVA